jgi:hypothetical protein
MAIIAPGKGRAVIEESGAGLRITIPVATQAFGAAFISVWFIGWAFGEAMAIRHLFGDPSAQNLAKSGSLFLLVWLTAWTLGGAWAIYTLLWQIAGKEILELTSVSLRQRKQIPLFSRSKEYAVANIENMRLAPPQPQFYPGNLVISGLSFKGGSISFDYGRDTHQFASGLDEADAKYVMTEMCKRVKSLCR